MMYREIASHTPLEYTNDANHYYATSEKEYKNYEDEYHQVLQDFNSKKTEWFEMDFSNTGIRCISPALSLYNHITALYLNNNRLTELPDYLFKSLRNLITLDISFNLLTSLPTAVGQLMFLEKLLAHQNRIVELPIEMGRLYKLKELFLDGNPLQSPPPNVLQQGTEMIVAYLRDRMPSGPPPPERRFISYLEPHVSVTDKDKFRMVSYNVLADSYAKPEQYPYCPSWALDWNYRKLAILKELVSYDADVICLQEVEAGHFNDYFQPELDILGYQGTFAPKSRARTMEDWGNVDGCATFFRKNRFVQIEDKVLEFQSLALTKHKEYDDASLSRLLSRDNIATLTILQFRDSMHKPTGGRGGGLAKAKYLLVCNTHIHWNPDNCDVKLVQVHLMMEQLSMMTASPKSKWHRVPVVIGGDFNSSVDSGPYEYLSSGTVGPHHPDLGEYQYGSCSTRGMQHSLNISSAYAPIGEPPFTNYTGNFVGILDYIWFTQESLGVSRVLQPVDEEAVKFARMPNAYFPSDHISLVADFFLKRGSMQGNSPMAIKSMMEN